MGLTTFSAREANRTNVSEWHILATVLDRILLICFSITLLTGSYFFYSKIGRHPIPEHPFGSQPNDIMRRNTTEYEDYRRCNEYHAGAALYSFLKYNFQFLILPNCNKKWYLELRLGQSDSCRHGMIKQRKAQFRYAETLAKV